MYSHVRNVFFVFFLLFRSTRAWEAHAECLVDAIFLGRLLVARVQKEVGFCHALKYQNVKKVKMMQVSMYACRLEWVLSIKVVGCYCHRVNREIFLRLGGCYNSVQGSREGLETYARQASFVLRRGEQLKGTEESSLGRWGGYSGPFFAQNYKSTRG